MAVPRMFTEVDPIRAKTLREIIGLPSEDDTSGVHTFSNETIQTMFGLPWELDKRVQASDHTAAGRQKLFNELCDESFLAALIKTKALASTWGVPTTWNCRKSQFQGAPALWEEMSEEICHQLEEAFFSTRGSVSLLHAGSSHRVSLVTGEMRIGMTSYEVDRVAMSHLFPLHIEPNLSAGEEWSWSLQNAVSMALWGIHDRSNALTEAIVQTMQSEKAHLALCARYNSAKARGEPGTTKDSPTAALGETIAEPQVCLFVLANCLKRPIIVYSEKLDHPARGIYMPMLWRDAYGMFPSEPSFPGHNPELDFQFKNPLLLAFNHAKGHFAPLVPILPQTLERHPRWVHVRVPITNPDKTVLHPHFCTEGERENLLPILQELLNLEEYMVPGKTVPTLLAPKPALGMQIDKVKTPRVPLKKPLFKHLNERRVEAVVKEAAVAAAAATASSEFHHFRACIHRRELPPVRPLSSYLRQPPVTRVPPAHGTALAAVGLHDAPPVPRESWGNPKLIFAQTAVSNWC